MAFLGFCAGVSLCVFPLKITTVGTKPKGDRTIKLDQVINIAGESK